MFNGLLQGIINTAGHGLSAVFYFLEPAGILVFWAFSLLAILRLLLEAISNDGAVQASPDDRPVPSWFEWALVGGFTALGAAVRLYGRETLPYWWDELLAVWISGSDIPTLVRTLASPAAPASDFTPPVFYLLLHAWQWLFGQSEASDRLLTISFSVLTIPAVHLLGKRLWGVGAGLGAAFLLSVSMTAVFFSQQVRCYSLLALLTVVFLLAAEGLYRRGGRRDVAFFLICAVLLLHTHFVATWVYAGVGAAYALTVVKNRIYAGLGKSISGAGTWFWRAGVSISGFALAAACPLFSPPFAPGPLIWIGTALLAVLILANPAPSEERARPWRADWKFFIVFSLPGLAFAPWLLHTRIWEVIAGKGAYNPNAYGLAELKSTVDFLAGLELSNTPYLLLTGLLALFVRRPRSALVLCGWVVFTTGLAMLVKNQNMNLVRYLSLTQAGYPLLFAVGCFETLDCAVASVSRAADLAAGARGASRKAASANARPRASGFHATVLLPFVVMALFGFVALMRISFPTQSPPSEDYRAAAAYLRGKGNLCLGFENQNMLRAITWYMRRDEGRETACANGCAQAFVLNVYPDGRPWSPGTSYVRWVQENARPAAVFPGLEVYVRDPSPPVPGGDAVRNHGWAVKGTPLLLELSRARSLAFAGDRLYPTAKQVVGRGEYEVVLPGASIERLSVAIAGQAVGPGSWVRARAWIGEGSPPAEVVVRGSDVLRADLGIKKGQGEVRFSQPLRPAPGAKLKVEVQLFDDGSGAIYSSNAGLVELAVGWE